MSISVRRLTVGSLSEAEELIRSLGADVGTIQATAASLLHRIVLVHGHIPEINASLLQQLMIDTGGTFISGRAANLILAGTLAQLGVIVDQLDSLPGPLSDSACTLREALAGEARASKTWSIAGQTLDLAVRPFIMGVLNVTPDSFSDGSRYLTVESAVARALEMEAEGADIIDIGGESTRPFAPEVDVREELRRVIPVIEMLSRQLRIPVSIDTYKAEVARAALQAGAAIINDVSGFSFDPGMAAVAASSDAGVVLMHTRGTPAEMQKETTYTDIVSEVISSLRASLDTAFTAGIAPDRIVIDPGIGFGKSMEGNLELIRRLGEFTCLNRPILVGTSRKSFIGKLLGREIHERQFGTAATVAVALAHGASIFRVHDVKEMRDVADMTFALT